MLPELHQEGRERVLRRRVAGDPTQPLVDVAGHRGGVERAPERHRRFAVRVGVRDPTEHRAPAVAAGGEHVQVPDCPGERPGDLRSARRREPPEVPTAGVDDADADAGSDDHAGRDRNRRQRPPRERRVRGEFAEHATEAAEPSKEAFPDRLGDACRKRGPEGDDEPEAGRREQPRDGVNPSDVQVERDRQGRAAVDAAVAFVAAGVGPAREQCVRQSVGDSQRACGRRDAMLFDVRPVGRVRPRRRSGAGHRSPPP